MSNIVEDIVRDYQNNLRKGALEVYYKKDIFEGLKLIGSIIGILKIIAVLGVLSGSAIVGLISYAANNPTGAKNMFIAVNKNKEYLIKLFHNIGSEFNNQ